MFRHLQTPLLLQYTKEVEKGPFTTALTMAGLHRSIIIFMIVV